MSETTLVVSKIPNLNTVVIKQVGGRDFFIAAPNSIVIPIPSLAFIISFLIKNNYISHKVIEGILEEYHSERDCD